PSSRTRVRPPPPSSRTQRSSRNRPRPSRCSSARHISSCSPAKKSLARSLSICWAFALPAPFPSNCPTNFSLSQYCPYASPDKLSNIQIKNFGCINEGLYRGAQPKEQDYADLAAMGVKTIIDLQRDGKDGEQALVEAQGMKFYRIGMSDKSEPSAEQAELFLK